ncbi:unnamed protein product, partial [Didymodactylos carnosus]
IFHTIKKTMLDARNDDPPEQKLRTISYVNPEVTLNTKTIRLRHVNNLNISNNLSQQSPDKPHMVLTAVDFEKYDNAIGIKYKHNKLQIFLFIITTFLYLIQVLRTYIHSRIHTESYSQHILPALIVKRPYESKFYSTEIRPHALIERVVYCTVESWQVLCSLYVLTHIPRKTDYGYLYRLPETFSIQLQLLLITS